MKISNIREYPTSLTREEVERDLDAARKPTGWHESLLRSYQTLQKVKDLLRDGTPPRVVLEIIEECGE
jgi:hypothetical protein